MARGNKKSAGAKVTSLESDYYGLSSVSWPKDDPAEMEKRSSVGDYKKDLATVAEQLIADVLSKGEVRDFFEEFLEPLTKYQGDRHFEHKGHKERRQKIAMMFDGLPDYVKQFLGMPKDSIKHLFRGANHPANPGPDGTINASFSGFKGWADMFKGDDIRRQFGHAKGDYDKEGKLYTSKDIESFKSVISLGRVKDLVREMYFQLTRGPKYDAGDTKSPFISQPTQFGRDLVTNLDFAWGRIDDAQAEYLVTDIKWKERDSDG